MRLLLSAVLVLMLSPLAWAAPPYQEGTHYQRLNAALPGAADDGVSVEEFFWYGCSHCYALEPHVAKWLQDLPEGVRFERVAAPLNPRWSTHSRAFYAARALGVLDTVHADLFTAIHEQRRPLDTPEALADFFAERGVARERFLESYNAFGVNVQVREALKRAEAARLMGVPALVVDGRYRTDVAMAGGYREVLDVVDFLVERARSEAGTTP